MVKNRNFGIFASNSFKDFIELSIFRKIFVFKSIGSIPWIFSSGFVQNPFKDLLNKKWKLGIYPNNQFKDLIKKIKGNLLY